MLSIRRISVFRKSLSLSPHPSTFRVHGHSFCSITKSEQSPLHIQLLDDLKQHKSETLSDSLSTLHLKKSGTKKAKMERLIEHFESLYSQHRLDDLTQSALKSYCNLLEIESDEMTKNEMIDALYQRFGGFIVDQSESSKIGGIPMPQHPERGTVFGTDSNSKYKSIEEMNLKTVSMTDNETATNQQNAFSFQSPVGSTEISLEDCLNPEPPVDIKIDETASFMVKNPSEIRSTVEFANGSSMVFESGRISHLSESAVVTACKGTMVLSTATSRLLDPTTCNLSDDGVDLKVDAHERSWPRGYIPSGIQRNDGGITDYEILLCRMIDRSIRPLFCNDDDGENGSHHIHQGVAPQFEVQVLSNLLSADESHDSLVLAINGAAAAVHCSARIGDVGHGAVAAVRVIIDGNGKMIANPTKEEMESDSVHCNLLYVGTKTQCVMMEAEGNEVAESEYNDAMRFAQKEVTKIVEAMERLKALNEEKRSERASVMEVKREREGAVMQKWNLLSRYKAKLLQTQEVEDAKRGLEALYSSNCFGLSKDGRNCKRNELKEQMVSSLSKRFENGFQFEDEMDSDLSAAELPMSSSQWDSFYGAAFSDIDRQALRRWTIDSEIRADGRRLDEVRDLEHSVDVLPSSHGSALFRRGDTQTLCSLTLGPPRLAMQRDLHRRNHEESKQRLYLQYEMAPSATNEIKAIQSKNRRAIGHGFVAQKALKPMLPDFESFPYSVRVFSNVTASDGSSSMATICGGSLCLMDAGVPMKAPVAGVTVGAMGSVLLSDISGLEDHFGDFDLKVGGSRKGINSLQLDIKKSGGLSVEFMCSAMENAKRSRLHILDSMNSAISESRLSLKGHAPRSVLIHVPFRDLPRVIGPGGATKQRLQIETRCDLNILWEGQCVEVTAPNALCLDAAKRAIAEAVGSQCRIGDVVTVQIVNVQSYGVMVRCDDGTEHLVHISQWMESSENSGNRLPNEGEMVEVLCIGFLGENRPNFSRKAAIWQNSDDPDDRARLRLMLDSLRPPPRSSGANRLSQQSLSVPANTEQQTFHNVSPHGMGHREPMSIFNDGLDDEYVETESVAMDSVDDIQSGIVQDVAATKEDERDSKTLSFTTYDDEEEDDESTTSHPTVLAPKSSEGTKPKSRTSSFGGSSAASIKRLVENLSSTQGIGDEESRFSNLYGERVSTQNESESAKTEKEGVIGSKFGSLLDSMRSGRASVFDVGDQRVNGKENGSDSNNEMDDILEPKRDDIESTKSKTDIDRWSDFTKTLMGSDIDKVERDEEGDDLLSDLFGDKHAAPSTPHSTSSQHRNGHSSTSRADKLMDVLPSFIEEPQSMKTTNNAENEEQTETEWPWLQKRDDQQQ